MFDRELDYYGIVPVEGSVIIGSNTPTHEVANWLKDKVEKTNREFDAAKLNYDLFKLASHCYQQVVLNQGHHDGFGNPEKLVISLWGNEPCGGVDLVSKVYNSRDDADGAWTAFCHYMEKYFRLKVVGLEKKANNPYKLTLQMMK